MGISMGLSVLHFSSSVVAHFVLGRFLSGSQIPRSTISGNLFTSMHVQQTLVVFQQRQQRSCTTDVAAACPVGACCREFANADSRGYRDPHQDSTLN
jgi:hypothetical protein